MGKPINTGIQGVSSDSVVARYKPTDAELKQLREREPRRCRSCDNTGVGLRGSRCGCLGATPKKPDTVDADPALSFDDLLKQAADAFGRVLISRNKWAKMAWARKFKIHELEQHVALIDAALERDEIELNLSDPAEELTECGHPRAQVEASQQMRNGPPGVGDVVWACYCPKCGKEWDE